MEVTLTEYIISRQEIKFKIDIKKLLVGLRFYNYDVVNQIQYARFYEYSLVAFSFFPKKIKKFNKKENLIFEYYTFLGFIFVYATSEFTDFTWKWLRCV